MPENQPSFQTGVDPGEGRGERLIWNPAVFVQPPESGVPNRSLRCAPFRVWNDGVVGCFSPSREAWGSTAQSLAIARGGGVAASPVVKHPFGLS
jgi:hypothetical protein